MSLRGNATTRVACAVACVLAAGCKRPAEAPRVYEVRVVSGFSETLPLTDEDSPRAAPPRALPVDTDALAKRVADRLRAGGVPVELAKPPREGVDYRVTVKVGVGLRSADDGNPGLLRAFVAARALTQGSHLDPIATEALADRRIDSKAATSPDSAARAHLERAVDDVTATMAALLRVHLGGTDELLATLGGARADKEVRAEAVRVAGRRRESRAVPALLDLLRGDDPMLRDRALGALVEIGDRRAVKPITEVARLRDRESLPKVIDAMGALGGDEARAYLEFVVSAHEDPELREMARAALARLDRGDGGASAGSRSTPPTQAP